MSHSHDHHDHSNHSDHNHSHEVSNISTAFFIAIVINIIFVGIEVFFGVQVHSLALLSDAGHNAMDVLNLILSGIALWLSKKRNTITYTYGYKRASIFSAFINSILLVVTALYLIFEAINRMFAPVETVGSTMMIVASIGILVNGISGWLLMRWGSEDINIKSAYLHLLGDALVSLGVVIGGAIIYFTGYTIVDPIISIVVSIVMIASVISLLKQSIRMNFDGVPMNVDIEEITAELREIDGIIDIHHIHIWSLSTTENALTAHIILQKWANEKEIKNTIRHHLEDENIHHTTLETEYEKCSNENCDC